MLQRGDPPANSRYGVVGGVAVVLERVVDTCQWRAVSFRGCVVRAGEAAVRRIQRGGVLTDRARRWVACETLELPESRAAGCDESERDNRYEYCKERLHVNPLHGLRRSKPPHVSFGVSR